MIATQTEKQYAEYLNYISRKEAGRTPMSREEFAEEYGEYLGAEEKATGIYDPMHY